MVAPRAFLTTRNSPSEASTVVNRRCGPIGTLKGLRGAGSSPAHASAPSPANAVPARPSSSRWPCTSDVMLRTASPGTVARSSSASASSCAAVGIGRGSHGRGGGATGCGSGLESKMMLAMSTPEMPSTSA